MKKCSNQIDGSSFLRWRIKSWENSNWNISLLKVKHMVLFVCFFFPHLLTFLVVLFIFRFSSEVVRLTIAIRTPH